MRIAGSLSLLLAFAAISGPARAQTMPSSELAALPSLGTIQWTLQDVPFVSPGPKGGISGAAMIALDKHIYLMGGFIPGGDGTTDRDRRTSRWTHRYDPATREWTRLSDLPERREYVRAETDGQDIYVIGGAKQQPYTPYGDVFQLRMKEPGPIWTRLASLNVPRTHLAVARVDHFLIAAGGNEYNAEEQGYGLGTIRTTTEVFDLRTPSVGWKKASPIPGLGRGWSASASVGGRMYLFGGVTWIQNGEKKAKTWTPETLSYDPVSDKWAPLTPPPVSGSGWSASVYRDRYIILVGGVRNTAPGTKKYAFNTDPIAYDTMKDRWFRFEAASVPPDGVYNDPGVAIIGDDLFVVGGEGPGSHFNHLAIGRIELNKAALE